MGIARQPQGIQIDRSDMGLADTLRYNVICFVVEENYEKAIDELRRFQAADSPYPGFQERIERYISHAVDLVNAIRAKRKFPGVHSLTMAKQQELNDRFHEHFNELQYVLKKIEKIQNELKLEDVRSTVIVLKAIINAAFAIAICAFLLEAFTGLGNTAWLVANDILEKTTAWIFHVIGF